MEEASYTRWSDKTPNKAVEDTDTYSYAYSKEHGAGIELNEVQWRAINFLQNKHAFSKLIIFVRARDGLARVTFVQEESSVLYRITKDGLVNAE